jgi:hypothetical protein
VIPTRNEPREAGNDDRLADGQLASEGRVDHHHGMVIDMNGGQVRTVERMQQVLAGTRVFSILATYWPAPTSWHTCFMPNGRWSAAVGPTAACGHWRRKGALHRSAQFIHCLFSANIWEPRLSAMNCRSQLHFHRIPLAMS